MSDYRDRMAIEPGKRGRKPCIRSLRITVCDVLNWLASGLSEGEIYRQNTRCLDVRPVPIRRGPDTPKSQSAPEDRRARPVPALAPPHPPGSPAARA